MLSELAKLESTASSEFCKVFILDGNRDLREKRPPPPFWEGLIGSS